jgi:hypothetical protein
VGDEDQVLLLIQPLPFADVTQDTDSEQQVTYKQVEAKDTNLGG